MKEKIKRVIASLVYWAYRLGGMNRLKVMSIEETLDSLLDSEMSLVRFGDGELQMIEGNAIPLQEVDQTLGRELYDVLVTRQEKILVAIPDIFASLEGYTKKSQTFWKEHLLFFRKRYERYCAKDYFYGNAFISRNYYIMEDKSVCGNWFAKARKIWKDKKVVVVEGQVSHNGVDNDLFSEVLSLERIICPSRNAYQYYEEIKAACLTYPRDTLFFLTVGNTAKPLVRDLVDAGYRALDMGSLDMEYYWFLEGVDYKKHPPKQDFLTIEDNRRAGYQEYLDQISYRIGPEE